MLRSIQFVLNERPVYDELGCCARQLLGSPRLDLPPHRLEIPLHAVHADRDGIDQREALGVFRQKRLELTRESKIIENMFVLASTGANTPETMFPMVLNGRAASQPLPNPGTSVTLAPAQICDGEFMPVYDNPVSRPSESTMVR